MLRNVYIALVIMYWSDDYHLYAKALDYNVPNMEMEKDQDYWYSLAKDDLDYALNKKIIENIAKNVIIFVGDGMGITATTAGRIFKGQKKGVSGEEQNLVWEKFSNAAFIKNYCLDKQVSDSAATATAIFGGVKANYATIGVNGKVKLRDCKASLKKSNRVNSVLKWSQDSGKDTGIVTTTAVTGATPAALYAHSSHRDWQCDTAMKNETNEDIALCKDIAVQLIEDDTGKNINVILGGGRNPLGANLIGDEKDACVRNDGRNLAYEWLKQKKLANKTATYVTNSKQLDDFDPKSIDYLLGLFAGSSIPFAYERKNNSTIPSLLKKLTEIAITRLSRNENGFFLMVEGGRIDHALHSSKAHAALMEIQELEEAVEAALNMTNIEDTLIIVTADHSHVMTINGYPSRGHDILGIVADDFVRDNLPYATLMFTTGFGANYSWNGERVLRKNLTNVDTRDMNFVFPSAVPTNPGSGTHGGEDIGIYAIGPMSHLFHRVHEQSYIAHVMAYSSCIGPFKNNCRRLVQDKQSNKEKNVQSKAGRGSSNKVLIFTVSSILVILKILVAPF